MTLAALLLTFTAAAAPVAAPAPRLEVLAAPRPVGGEWHGLLLMGQKAGWSFGDLVEESYEGVPAVRSTSKVVLKLTVAGKVVERSVEDDRWYEKKPGGRLLGFLGVRRGDGGDRRIEGRCDLQKCTIRFRQPAGEETRTVPLPAERVDDADPTRLAALRGKDVTSRFLDLDSLEERAVSNRFGGRKPFVAGGVSVAAIEILTRSEGEAVDSVAWLDATDGRLLELTMSGTMKAVPMAEAEAKKLDGTLDVFGQSKVPLPRALPNGAAKVTLLLEGLPPELRRADARQRFEALPDGTVRVRLSSHRPAKAPAKLPVDRALFARELAATPTVDHDSPAIVALARTLVPKPEGQEPLHVAAVLAGWVNGSLAKVYGASSDRATRVLAEKRGDCTEHALLFVALARASGLPARTVHGLVSADMDGTDALFWHEWAEVWAGEWIAVDPTFGQLPADATHLTLGEQGTSSAVALIGQLRVLEATLE